MRITSILRASCIAIISYIILALVGGWLSTGTLFEVLYGAEAFQEGNVQSTFHTIQTFFQPVFYVTISVGIGALDLLFSSPAFDRRYRGIKILLSLAMMIYVGVLGLNLYILHDQMITDMQSHVSLQSDQPQEEVVEQTYPNIIIQADEELYAYDIAEIQQAIDSMPHFLLKHCRNIYILDTQQYEEEGKELEMDDPNQTAAFSYSGDMSIRIRIIDDPTILNTYLKTMAHELSHIYDFSQGNAYKDPSGCSNTKEFMALYEAAPNSLSEYGSTSQYEFFAEGGGLYITEPQMLYELNPDVYAYFDRLYGPQMNE